MNMKINGYLMSKDTVIATIHNGEVQPVCETLMPFHFKKTGTGVSRGGFESWLEGRAIDTHRSNSRLLKKALRLTTVNDAELVLKVNAATITDTYWFKSESSSLKYDDIRFKENMFDKLALYGDPDSFSKSYSPTPELTNTGSFEKCWRLSEGKWWLYKQGNDWELFSELFICEFGTALGFNMARYEKDGKYIRSLDFTDGASINYEPADSITGGDEDYDLNFRLLTELSENCAADYIAMIYLDTLCFNMDRHTKNYGILRNVDSGETLGLAPNFDNNIALISRGYPNQARQNDLLFRLFDDFLRTNRSALDCFTGMNIPYVDKNLIETCIDRVPVDVDRTFICDFIMSSQDRIKDNTERLAQEQGMDFCPKMSM
jgi:hypothetical protein